MDSIWLTGPLGTQWNIGSWLDKTDQIDYGAAGLIRQQFSQNAFVEGAQLAYETAAGVRTMRFPLIVPSGAFGALGEDEGYGALAYGAGAYGGSYAGVAGLSLDAVEASLRQMVRPGGYVDLQPANVATGEMVRFDILGGDVAHRNWSIDVQRISRRQLMLQLQTQPFGYWPTWITLASVASVSLLGNGRVDLTTGLHLPRNTVVGDAPALTEITIVPTTPTQLTASEINFVDGIAWSVAGHPSFLAGLGGGSWSQLSYVATYTGAIAAGIGATAITVAVPPASAGFGIPFIYNIASAVEPAYRGRFRAFAKLLDQAARPHRVTLDTQTENLAINGIAAAPLASANPVATVAATVGNSWRVVDLGELTLPAYASGIQQSQWLRIWADAPSWGATTLLELGGVYMLPVDGVAGLAARGVAAGGGLSANVPIRGATANPAGFLIRPDLGPVSLIGSAPVADLRRYHYGPMPYLGGTNFQLDLFGYDRKLGASSAIAEERAANPVYAAVSVRYRPRFQFLKGL